MNRSPLQQTTPRLTRGFTLIEALIYFALLTIMSAGAVTFLFSLEDLFLQYRVQQELFNSGTLTMERILSEIRTSDAIDLGSSVVGDITDGVLVLESDGIETEFNWNGSTIDVTVDGDTQGALTSDTVTVDRFTVYHYPTAIGETVRVELRLSAAVEDFSASTRFHGAADIRGSYD